MVEVFMAYLRWDVKKGKRWGLKFCGYGLTIQYSKMTSWLAGAVRAMVATPSPLAWTKGGWALDEGIR